MLRSSDSCLPSVPFQTAWLAALLYLCFSLRKRSSKGHFGLMAGWFAISSRERQDSSLLEQRGL